MGKKSPKAPAPPDPVATAQAQTQSNVDTARVNFANNAVNQYTPYGSLEWNQWAPDRWSAVQTLAGPEQHMLNQERYLGSTMNDIAGQQLSKVGGILNTPFNANSLPAYAPTRYLGQANAVDYAPTRYLTAANAVDFAGAPQMRHMPGAERVNPESTNRIAELMMQRASPQFNAQREGIRSNLINSGVREGTEAWSRAMDDYNRQYNDATIAAQLAAGQEQSRDFQNRLASQQSYFGQEADATGRNFDMEMARANYQNQLRGAQIGEHERAYALNVAADQQQNALRQAQIAENERAYQFQNAADQQQNALRQAQLQEAAYLRQMPLNEISALMSGSQIQGPSFINTPSFSAQPGNLMDATYQSYAGQQNAYNQQMQNVMANRAGIYGLLGQGLGIGAFGLAGGFSDERLKRDILRIGALPSGLPVYSFRFLWEPEWVRHIGVMAQEVMKVFPEAVGRLGGWLMVNYAAIR